MADGQKHAAMMLEFVKKRWFTLALVLLLLAALVRKNIRFQADDAATPPAQESHGKYTDAASSPKATALLNVGGDGIPASVRLPEVDDATAVAFLKRFASVAVSEQEKFGMPASVLLACAYLNSFAGKRSCATEANNYLAIRCSADWNGPEWNDSGTCFRKYETAWESIRDFNVIHSRKDWYVALKNESEMGWKTWVKKMAVQRVSDVEGFEKEMGRLIQEYRLFELDGL